jgi:3-deoxy-manno-octulosonate cytidylyltransferase (CMP-KDO synthetase)
MKIAAVIPARFHSTRLPGKPLADIAGDPMIRWVYERARRAHLIDEVWVATDDERIHRAVESFGGNACMTSPRHTSGTDRLAEVARNTDWDIVINVQGDEPLIDPAMVDAVADCLRRDASVLMSTLKRPLQCADDLSNPNVVKVVTDKNGYALYFSRSPLPFFREGWKSPSNIEHLPPSLPVFGHIGLYAYQRDFLLTLSSLSPTPLEKVEQLEQLRALEHGFRIKVETFEKDSFGVDTREDLEKVRQIVAARGLSCSLE